MYFALVYTVEIMSLVGVLRAVYKKVNTLDVDSSDSGRRATSQINPQLPFLESLL